MSDQHFASAQVSAETAERLDNFIEEYGLTKSQAVRLFIESGLDVIERDGMDPVVQREYQLTGHSPRDREELTGEA